MIAIKKYSVIFLALFATCAHQIPPGGGPDDKTPPAIYSTTPRRGEVGVAATSEVVFTFSKWIQTRNPEKYVTVFPPPQGGIKVSVSGRKLKIKPRITFGDSTTYHVSLNTALSDLHGNSIGTPYDLYFSTGRTIDSCRIYGCVISPEGKPGQPKVALFPAGKVDLSDTVFFGDPDYLAQTDSTGSFSFDNIHRGTYDIAAFSDENNNGKIDPGKENVFAAVEKRIILDRIAGPVQLYPVTCDTVAMRIAVIKPVSSGCIYGEWAGSGPMSASPYDTSWRIEDAEKSRIVPVREYVPVLESRRFYLMLGDTLGPASYRLVYPFESPMSNAKHTRMSDTIRFNGVVFRDTVLPFVKGSAPRGVSDLKPQIKLAWSKPVRAFFSQWYCVDSLKDSITVAVTPGLCDTTVFIAHRSLTPGMTYTMTFPDSAFADIVGNRPKDSAGIKIAFRTITDRELCFSLSGSISCLKSDSLRKWMFMPIGGSKHYLSKDIGGRFRFDSIPAAKGTMAFFIDVNHDDKPTRGSLVPWMPPEPFRTFPDTIEARRNWDIEGVAIPAACEACVRKSGNQTKVDPLKNR